MKIYIDNDNKCHSSNDGTLREFDLAFFEGKCDAYIEGYRYVPEGETWTRADGELFAGEMLAPAVDSRILEAHHDEDITDIKSELQLLTYGILACLKGLKGQGCQWSCD